MEALTTLVAMCLIAFVIVAVILPKSQERLAHAEADALPTIGKWLLITFCGGGAWAVAATALVFSDPLYADWEWLFNLLLYAGPIAYCVAAIRWSRAATLARKSY